MGDDRSMAVLQAASGGVLAGLALSLHGGWWLGGPLWMTPALALLWSVLRQPFAAALWGLVAVLVSHRWLLALHPLTWIGVPAPLSLPVATLIWLLCGLAAGVLVGLWAWLATLTGRRRWPAAVLLAGCWGLAEVALARTPLFWIGVGGSLLPADPWLAGLARWLGAGGLAALLLLLGWWLWRLVRLVQLQARGQRSTLLVGVVLLVLAHGLGGWGQRWLPTAEPALNAPHPAAPWRVALWQPAIPTREKFLAEQQLRLPARLDAALVEAARAQADWLVVPEGTLPLQGRLQEPAPLPLLTGGFRWHRGRQRSALLLIPAGARQPSDAIDKHRLVPLGEWVPSWLGAGPGLSAVGGLEPGAPARLWRWNGPPAAVAICYEISNGAALARAVADGAQWLLTIANLDPYPVLLQRQFLALAQLRSVETARPLLSAANTGPTATVAATGEVRWLLPSGAAAVAIAPLVPADGLSAYVRWREAPLVWLTLLAALLMLRQRQAGSGPRPAAVPPSRTPPPDPG